MRLPSDALARGSELAWNAWPILAFWPAWFIASRLWRLVILTQHGSPNFALAFSAWPTMALLGPALVMAIAVSAWRFGRGSRSAAMFGILAFATCLGVLIWPEYRRLSAYWPEYPLDSILGATDLNIVSAVCLGCLAIGLAGRITRRATKPQSQELKRARSDIHGHSDWMGMKEAQQLFSAGNSSLGGVVIGEAYRVDHDRGARVPFNPSDRSSWGKGGTAPLLEYDLSWGATHGLVFAGSGSYKTVSTCVPTLLRYQGPIVCLDPSTELAPMLNDARQGFSRKAIAIDPANPAETGFNAIDWLDVKSTSIDANIRAVVDWICGEKAPAKASEGGNGNSDYFENRGKAIVESVLSDLVFDRKLPSRRRTLKVLARRLAAPEENLRKQLRSIHDNSRSSNARHLAGQLMGLTPVTYSGVYGAMSQQTAWLANPRYADLVSSNAFRTAELTEGGLDLFINVPMKILETTPALARVIVGALMNALYEADGAAAKRVVFLLDEVARLGFMSSLARARDAGRKYGITMLMIYQSEGQMAEQWGQEGRRAWFESVSWRSYAAIGDIEQAKSVSETCGDYGVVVITEGDSTGTSGKLLELGTQSSGRSRNRAEQRRRLIAPEEILADMRTDEQIVFVRGRPPLRCGRAMYFRRPEMAESVSANRFSTRSLR